MKDFFKRKIKKGDIVVCIFTDNDVSSKYFQSSSLDMAIVTKVEKDIIFIQRCKQKGTYGCKKRECKRGIIIMKRGK